MNDLTETSCLGVLFNTIVKVNDKYDREDHMQVDIYDNNGTSVYYVSIVSSNNVLVVSHGNQILCEAINKVLTDYNEFIEAMCGNTMS